VVRDYKSQLFLNIPNNDGGSSLVCFSQFLPLDPLTRGEPYLSFLSQVVKADSWNTESFAKKKLH